MSKIRIMALDKQKQGALSNAGYSRSSNDPEKWINKSNGHWLKEKGDSYIVKTDHHSPYGKNEQSLGGFKKRI